MPRVALPEIDLGSVHDAVGAAAYRAALRDMQDGAVRRLDWDPSASGVLGVVCDSGGEFHETVVYLATSGKPARFGHAFCSCPKQSECKHAAAVVLAAALSSGQDLTTRPSATPWEQSLAALLDLRAVPGAAPQNLAPVALELSLSADTDPYRHDRAATGPQLSVRARLVQRGARDNWVGSQLSWSSLDRLHEIADVPAGHVRVLSELFWTYQSGDRHADYYYPYRYSSSQRYIDLASFESRQLWPLLEEVAATGLPLIYGRKLGAVPRHGAAAFVLDLTRSGPVGPLTIRPLIRVEGTDAEILPIRFIGSQAHGLAFITRPEAETQPDPARWRFQLARLSAPIPRQLQDLVLSGQPLRVPAAEESKFRAHFYPRLRHAATLVSSDDSVSLPEISAPTLVLGAAYGDNHELDVSWEWAYQIGGTQLRAPAGPGVAGPAELEPYRDIETEQSILSGLDVSGGRVRSQRLAGIETMLFSTEVLPILTGQPGVEVEISGTPAAYREAGDSLRIGISADALPEENDWFGLGVTITVEGGTVPFADLFLALSRGDSYLLLDNGAYFPLDKPGLQALARLIEEARGLQDAPPGHLRISRYQVGLWADLAELGIITRQAATWQRQVAGLLAGGGVGDGPAPPASLTAELRPYQLDGFRWLAFLWEHRLGGILADDMGLGKTLQALALISHARQAEPGADPFLVVAPTSVVSNWSAEAARFAPDLKVVVIGDTLARRKKDLAEVIADADAVVTTYTLLRIDFASYSAAPWSGLILDEAQYAKNHQSKIHQCVRRLPAPFKLAITGTPMENNLMELWSLLSITAPGLFPHPERFRDYYARPIEKHGKAELLEQLRRRIKPLVKRRTKEQVAKELPAKQEQVLEVDLHPRHSKLYLTHLQRERQKVLRLITDLNANRFTILRSLTLLRQLSLHAGLVDAEYEDVPCSKLDTLLDLLGDAVGAGHRALVFSQFTRFLERARERLDAAGISYSYLDGSTRHRELVIQRFKSGQTPVFLISLKAGGFGLNLTEADYCFLLDPWWNPATEAQAVDRTHRIGQTRNVVVYRLISKDTIEEKVMALKARKAALFSSVIDSGNAFGGSLDANDIRGLFE
jgi:superfamily II DNA or RNA helicase